MLTKKMAKLQKEAILEINNHPNHELILPMRKKIWKEMGPLILDDEKALFGVGLYRRASLAIITAKKVYPIWLKHFPPEIFDKSIDSAEQYLSKQIDFETGYEIHNTVGARMMDPSGVNQDQFTAVYSGHAAWNALGTALYDEKFEVDDNFDIIDSDELDDDLDSDMWDTGYYAAMAYAGGAPFEQDKCDYQKLKEFWEWYVNEAILEAFKKAVQY